MSETLRMGVEVAFNAAYLVTVWTLVVLMVRQRAKLQPQDRAVGRLFIWAFALLALGDTGHVGLRIVAYALGDLEATVRLMGAEVGLVGLGALSTAITVTLFYVLLVAIWRASYRRPYGWFGALLFVAAVARLAIMVFPQNQWSAVVPPQGWSLLRNAPLVLQGLGVAYLVLRDAGARGDRTFSRIGVCILLSYAFYAPVILFVQTMPLIGMLMIPKTLAYVAIAILAYRRLFRRPDPAPTASN